VEKRSGAPSTTTEPSKQNETSKPDRKRKHELNTKKIYFFKNIFLPNFPEKKYLLFLKCKKNEFSKEKKGTET